MLPDRVSNPRPLTYESGALPTALRGPAVNLFGYLENELKATGNQCSLISEIGYCPISIIDISRPSPGVSFEKV